MLQILRRRFSGLSDSVVRYPVTVVFLIAAAVLTAVNIAADTTDNTLLKVILTCAAGAAAGGSAQSAYERFFSGAKWRAVLYLVSIVVTALFYITIRRIFKNSPETALRTIVTIFTLFIAFIWLAVIRSRYSFAAGFMASFKALFQALFYSGILFLGCAAIIAAIDRLITPVDSDAYSHVANIVFVLFAPLLFLSMVPVYPGRRSAAPDQASEALIEKRTGCPKFLEVLLSYIVIPLIAVFTVVLLIYIALNIGGKFWTNNLLEPLLISYTVVVITVTLLVGRLENKFAVLFRMIFPKVLIPVALFQTIASILLMADTGVTYTRYYVILYGFFAIISGAVLSTVPLRRSGTIAAVLIILSVLSLTPPTDAFTVSRISHIRTLEHVLKQNNMLADNKVVPDAGIPDADKAKIATAIRYLSDMDELHRVKWLPAGFNGYDDSQFFSLFGFHEIAQAQPYPIYVSVYFEASGAIAISGYDAFSKITVPGFGKAAGQSAPPLVVGGRPYSLAVTGSQGAYAVTVKDGSGQELLRYDLSQVFRRYAAFPQSKSLLTPDEATFTAENTAAALMLVVENAGFQSSPDITNENAQLFVFLKIK